MFKTIPGLFLLVFICFAFSAKAQKADSLKADTNLLNKFRIDPGKNPLPFRFRPTQIQKEEIPVTLLDYKISYWHKSILFGLNFSQAAFTSNYSAGGISSIALGSNFEYKLEYNKAPRDYTSDLQLTYGISKVVAVVL